ncbi:hypothetical protein ABTK18_19520, partial [Acinetobacter baumannii]
AFGSAAAAGRSPGELVGGSLGHDRFFRITITVESAVLERVFTRNRFTLLLTRSRATFHSYRIGMSL